MSSDFKSLIKELAEYLIDTSSSVKISSAGVLTVNGERLLAKDFTNWLIGFIKSDETRKFSPILLESPSPVTSLEMLKVSVRSCHQANKTVQSSNGETIRSFQYDNQIPFISVKDSNKIIFFNKNSNKLADLDYGTYKMVVDTQYQIKPLAALVEFNPYRPEQMYMGRYEDMDCTHINTYMKPEWQLGRKLDEKESKEYPNLSLIIEKFFEHLFPDEHCRDFVYDWLHYALESRCETYLVMNGAKGIGKNVLSNHICPSLVGKDNHKIAHKGSLDNFNAILSECRMIVFDEFKIVDDEAINTLKRFANTDQMIERKGIDVKKTEKTYNSYIICNNAVTDMKIEWDDRRFSVVDITDRKLDDVWSVEKISMLMKVITNPNSPEMIGFGYWLLYRKPKVMTSVFSVWKGPHFYKLCYTSMPEWAKMIIDEVTSGHPKPYYDEAELKMMLKERTNGMNRFPQRTKVEDFLKNYKHKGESYLGYIEVDERTYYLQVAPEFVKSTADNTGNNWLSLTDELL